MQSVFAARTPPSPASLHHRQRTSLRHLILNADDMIAQLQALDNQTTKVLDDEEVRELD